MCFASSHQIVVAISSRANRLDFMSVGVLSTSTPQQGRPANPPSSAPPRSPRLIGPRLACLRKRCPDDLPSRGRGDRRAWASWRRGKAGNEVLGGSPTTSGLLFGLSSRMIPCTAWICQKLRGDSGLLSPALRGGKVVGYILAKYIGPEDGERPGCGLAVGQNFVPW